jgi:pimeloyl-[acyl-carrier protein] synthase
LATDEFSFNPLDPELAIDPFPALRRLRDRERVHFVEALNMYVVTGHAEARTVLRRPDGDYRFAAFQQGRVGDLSSDPTAEPYCVGLSNFVLMKSGEDHRRARAAFARQFTHRHVDELRDRITQNADRLIDGFAHRGLVELVQEYAKPLPLATIAELLAVPEHDREVVGKAVSGFMVAIEFRPFDSSTLEVANRSIQILDDYFTGLIHERRRSPGDDLLSLLIAEADAGALTERELLSNVWGLFVGGHDTTEAGIANTMATFLAYPDQLQILRDDPTLIPNGVDEALRFNGPAGVSHRIFCEPVELAGRLIPADTPILVYFTAANRDETFCQDGERLDVRRKVPLDHLAFSSGPHNCPGRHLARATVQIAIGALLRRLPDVLLQEVAWDTAAIGPRKVAKLIVRWRPEPHQGHGTYRGAPPHPRQRNGR